MEYRIHITAPDGTEKIFTLPLDVERMREDEIEEPMDHLKTVLVSELQYDNYIKYT